ncbi:MAG: chemotaxis protein MotB [Halioglobus sp.]|jgi:chemotaxis protein MotB
MIALEDDDDSSRGSPAWMATFADLMSLLMCFFVLLLSFSELDVLKYKQVAGSMREAFGVQNTVNVMDIPKGTSIIAQEFSPGRTQPTPIKTVTQFTTETTKASLRVGNPTAPELDDAKTQQLLEQKLIDLIEKTSEDADKLRQVLEDEINEGKIDIESEAQTIIVRVREKGAFPSGSATLNPNFIPVMDSLRDALVDIGGKISVEGHTDNIPISSARFMSNWDLSASRALTVTHELVKKETLDSDRFMVVGRAATQPYKPNTSVENRSFNRRVEIIIRQGLAGTTDINIGQLQGLDVD